MQTPRSAWCLALEQELPADDDYEAGETAYDGTGATLAAAITDVLGKVGK